MHKSIIQFIIIKMGSCAPQLLNQAIILLGTLKFTRSSSYQGHWNEKVLSQYNTRAIKELDVAGNSLTPLTLTVFPKVKWTSLTFLNFNKNKLGYKGCKYLSMATLNRLQRLVLSQNNIGNGGVLHLSKAMWKSLKYLSLSFNHIQHQGAQHLSKAKWDNIETISAYNNKVDDSFPLNSTIILVTSHPQESMRQVKKGNVAKANPAGAFMDNGLLLELY